MAWEPRQPRRPSQAEAVGEQAAVPPLAGLPRHIWSENQAAVSSRALEEPFASSPCALKVKPERLPAAQPHVLNTPRGLSRSQGQTGKA